MPDVAEVDQTGGHGFKTSHMAGLKREILLDLKGGIKPLFLSVFLGVHPGGY